MTGVTVTKVEYWIDGQYRDLEQRAPYVFGGDDFFFVPNKYLSVGKHVLLAKVFTSSGAVLLVTTNVTVK